MASFCSADFIEGSPRFHSLQPFLLVKFIQLEGQTRAHTFPCVTLQRIIFLFQNNLHFEWLRAVSFTFPSLPQTKLEEKKNCVCVHTCRHKVHNGSRPLGSGANGRMAYKYRGEEKARVSCKRGNFLSRTQCGRFCREFLFLKFCQVICWLCHWPKDKRKICKSLNFTWTISWLTPIDSSCSTL